MKSIFFIMVISTRMISVIYSQSNIIIKSYNSQNAPLVKNDLPDSRIVDWSIAGLDSTAVTCPTAIYNVLEATPALNGDGQSDNSKNLQSLIDDINSYPSPCVFYFPAGTYVFNSKINMVSGRIIRGISSDSTIFISNSNEDLFSILKYDYGSFTAITGGYNKGSTVVNVADASKFEVGKHIHIVQKNILSLFPEEWAKSWSKDAIGMIARVISIEGDKIHLDRPLRIDFDDDNGNGYIKARSFGLIENVGFENFYIKANNPNMDGSSFFFKNAANCWICGIESELTKYHQVTIQQSCNIEVRNSYFHKSYSYNGGRGYGIALSSQSGNCLIENNVFDSLRHSMLSHLGSSGNVFAYNYSINPLWAEANGDPSDIPPDISLHGHYAYMELFEGNIVQEITSSDWWGPVGAGVTFFRNRVEQSNLHLKFSSHNQNVIGNELTGGNTIIRIQDDVQGTIVNGNNVNGTISFDPDYSSNLASSFYLDEKPSFFGNNMWPSIGPVFQLNTGTIPAKIRYLQNKPVQKCNCGEINRPLTITLQPENQLDICYENEVKYTITGDNITAYKWQILKYNQNEWTDISDDSLFEGSKSANLVFIAIKEVNNAKFRCIVSNNQNNKTSDIVQFSLESEAPIINSSHPDQQLYANEECEVALIDFTKYVTATDNCDDSLTIIQIPEEGNIISGAINNIKLIVTDKSGNHSDVSFNIEVIDTVKPIIECINSKTIELTQGQLSYTVKGTEFDPVKVTDNCDISGIRNNLNEKETLDNVQLPIDTTVFIWTAIDNNSNKDSCSFSIVVTPTTGTISKNLADIKIFPNPVESNINIISESEMIYGVSIYNYSGQSILNRSYKNKKINLSIGFMPIGFYIVKLQLKNQVFLYRFVKGK